MMTNRHSRIKMLCDYGDKNEPFVALKLIQPDGLFLLDKARFDQSAEVIVIKLKIII